MTTESDDMARRYFADRKPRPLRQTRRRGSRYVAPRPPSRSPWPVSRRANGPRPRRLGSAFGSLTLADVFSALVVNELMDHAAAFGVPVGAFGHGGGKIAERPADHDARGVAAGRICESIGRK